MATDVEKLLVRVEANLKQYEKEMARARGVGVKAMRELERDTTASVSRIERSFAKAGTAVKAGFGGFIAGLGAEQLARAAATAIKSIADIGDQATKLGLSNAEFQELKLGAQLAGVEVAALAGGMKKLGVNSSDAVRGQGEFGAILKANNVSLLDQNGQMRSQVEILGIVANLVANAASEQDGLAIAQAALGKSGTELMVLLEQGATGVEAAMRKAKDAGVQFTDEQIAKAQEYDDKIDVLIETISVGLKGAFIDLAPAAEGFFNSTMQEFDALAKGAQYVADKIKEMQGLAVSGEGKGDLGPGITTSGFRADSGDVASLLASVDSRTKPPSTVLPTKPTAVVRSPSRLPSRDAIRVDTERVQRLRELERQRANAAREFEADRLDAAQKIYDYEFDVAQQASDAFVQRQQELRDGLLSLAEIGVSALDAIVIGGEKAGDVLKGMVKQLASAALQATLLGQGPLAGIFGGGGGIFGALLGGLTGGVSAGIYHNGGTVGNGGPSRSVSPSTFANAPRYHSGGIAGLKSGEVPAILQKGEIVIPRGGSKSGGGNVFAPVIYAQGADAAALKRVESQLYQMNRDMNKRVIGAVGRERNLNPGFAT